MPIAHFEINRNTPKFKFLPTKGMEIIEHASRKRFLVVEDDFAGQPIWEKIIRTLEPQAIIRWATTSEAAQILIEKAMQEGEAFDIVVSDIFLGGKGTGLDLWKKFHSPSVEFLLMSGMDWKDFVTMVDDVGDIKPCLLQKPFRVADGVSTLATVMASEKL